MIFDEEFEAFPYLNETLLYFKDIDLYMAPLKPESRLGYPPGDFTANHGLFIGALKVGNLTSGVSRIDYIPAVGADKNIDKMEIVVDFDSEDPTQNEIKLHREFAGYNAMFIHPFMNLIPEDTKKEIAESFAKTMNENLEVVSYTTTNEDPANFGVLPLIYDIDVAADVFCEKAGNKYLFKVGELIGPQMEMYQDKTRKLPLVSGNTRTYYRTITLNIPEGYSIYNPEDVVINKNHSIDDEEVYYFRSSYKIEGNQFIITADEAYDRIVVQIQRILKLTDR